MNPDASGRYVMSALNTCPTRSMYLSTTDPALSADAVVGAYCGRWSIETTFPEARSALGLETTRGWCKKTVVRAGPCPRGLYTVRL